MAERLVRYELCCVAFRVINDNPSCLAVKEGVEMREVTRTDGKIRIGEGSEYSVWRRHPRHGYDEICVLANPRFRISAAELIKRTAKEFALVKQEMEQRYGMTLSATGHIINQGHFVFNSRTAQTPSGQSL